LFCFYLRLRGFYIAIARYYLTNTLNTQ
jgi:hypothetical protein